MSRATSGSNNGNADRAIPSSQRLSALQEACLTGHNMDFKEQFQNLKETLDAWLDQTKEYFNQLNEYEIYGWIGEGVGVAVLVTGIILL